MSEWKESRIDGKWWRELSINDRTAMIMANQFGHYGQGIIKCTTIDDYLCNCGRLAADFIKKQTRAMGS